MTVPTIMRRFATRIVRLSVLIFANYSADATHNPIAHRRCLLLTRVGQALLNPAREFFLPAELDLRVFLGHADRAVAGDFRGFNARRALLLPPRDVGAPEGVWTE